MGAWTQSDSSNCILNKDYCLDSGKKQTDNIFSRGNRCSHCTWICERVGEDSKKAPCKEEQVDSALSVLSSALLEVRLHVGGGEVRNRLICPRTWDRPPQWSAPLSSCYIISVPAGGQMGKTCVIVHMFSLWTAELDSPAVGRFSCGYSAGAGITARSKLAPPPPAQGANCVGWSERIESFLMLQMRGWCGSLKATTAVEFWWDLVEIHSQLE